MMHAGVSLDRVEREVIEPSGLTQDQQAALWLYAWACANGGARPSEGARHLETLQRSSPLS